MRIGISTSVIQRGRTGIAQYLFALLRASLPAAREHHVTLFVLEEDLPLFEFARTAMEIIPVPEQVRPPAKNILWHQFHLPQLARKHQLDVLHVPSYRRMLWPKPCALVATIHDLAPFHVAGKYDWKRMLYGRVICRALAKRQDEIIAISENTAQDIRRFFGAARERLTVIHNGLEHERFHPGSRDEAKAEAARAYAVHQPFFLYVARLEHPGKNHVRLIAAFNRFKAATGLRWQLVLAGSDWHGAGAIHDAIGQSPFSTDIHSLGFVPDEALPNLYRAADAFVYPSLYEGFGMPPTEAMACGCPVISSTCGSLGEIVGNAAALVKPDDVGSIAGQLATVASDPELRARLQSAGFQQAQRFHWNNTAAETFRIYERAVTRTKSAGAGRSGLRTKMLPDTSPR